VIDTIERERVTTWPALGSAAPRVAAQPDVTERDLSSLTGISVGGAPVSPSVQQALRAAFPQASQGMRMGYTSSEAVSIVASIGGQEFVDNPTSTGPIQWGVQVEIRDEAGRPLPDGVDGEVHVRSPYVMLGYWNNPDATAEVLKPGRWLAMGDVGHLRAGRLYINSRARDLVFVSAENVFPTEVEYRLDAHPGVGESAVVGVDDPVTGQALRAYVVPAGEGAVTEDILRQWCTRGLARYKVPTQWVIRRDPLPRTASGKVMKDHLLRT
jgi:acyl-CoA synthetase (AMP-forming)/AMP-acid ligase II